MATKPGATLVVDKGMQAAMARQKALGGHRATVGIHGDVATKAHGDVDNIQLAVVHEFGANIQHPGGTPYTVFGGGGGRSGGMVGGKAIFLRKGDPRATGVTRPHAISIPERSFLRSAFDKNRVAYERLLEMMTGRVIDGTATPKQAVGTVGEKHIADIVNGINAGIPPPLKPATAERKGSTTPLIDTGQLKMSIKVKVTKG